MIFRETELAGAWLLELEPIEDERGFFARSFCRHEFEDHGLNPDLAQCNISFNHESGTLRGLHYQAAPHEEDKLVRCTRGEIWDVIVDLRPTLRRSSAGSAATLSEDNRHMLYVPKGFAHGFLTLAPESEVFYQMSEFFHPDSARGLPYDDPAFGIDWPQEPRRISDKDRSYAPFGD